MSVSVGVLYRIPRSLLIHASLTGTVSWLVMKSAAGLGANIIFAFFLGALTVGIVAEILARIEKKPATIFIIPGFIPLVPGREAYMTMLYMVRGDYAEGVSMAMKTLLIGGAIAFGIFISATVFRLLQNKKARGLKND